MAPISTEAGLSPGPHTPPHLLIRFVVAVIVGIQARAAVLIRFVVIVIVGIQARAAALANARSALLARLALRLLGKGIQTPVARGRST